MRAKYKVYFRNGFYRLVCGCHVKKYKSPDLTGVEKIELFKIKN